MADKTVLLQRTKTSIHGTFGLMLWPGGWSHTIELPWRENRSNISCIPNGEYLCEIVHSPRFGRCYQVKDVPGRSAILIHSGNLAGDVSCNLLTHSHGCILPGAYVGKIGEQKAVLASRVSLNRFMSDLGGWPFTISIKGDASWTSEV